MVSKLALVQIASIDDTLIWCKNISTIMLYLECNCKIFQKYRVSFRLNECRFLEERVEYVCHNLTSEVNYPACGIFDLIHVQELDTLGQSLYSCIGLVVFYYKYTSYLEIPLKPLYCLIKTYFRKYITIMAWTSESIQIFEDIKICITSFCILACYNSDKPTFLKPDWIVEDMGYIIIQPANDE